MLTIAYHPIYKHPLPKGHRFPMEKYELLPKQLLHEGTCTSSNFFTPGFPEESAILAVHDTAYVKNLKSLQLDKSAIRKLGFPLSKALVERELYITQGTILGCEYALKNGISFNIAGGTHHAYTDHGEAFCLLNDQAIGARNLLNNYSSSSQKTLNQIQTKPITINKVLIVDLDVHQGNGTAQIFKNEPNVFTFSMHGASNYPFKKEISDLDIALPNNTNDEDYLAVLKDTLPRLVSEERPDFIFYLSGVDILKTDKLGKLGCSIEGCKKRDEFVFNTCKQSQIPVQVSMGGGYSPEIKTIIEAHANTYRVAQEIYF